MAGTGYNQQQQQSSTHDHYQQIKHSYFHYTNPQQHSPVLLNDSPSSPLACTPTHHRTTVIGGSTTNTTILSSSSPWYPSSTMTTTDFDDSAFRDGISDVTQTISNVTIDNDCNENNQQQSYENYGHFFVKKTFHKPTYCHHCVEMLWGLIGQGYYCEGKRTISNDENENLMFFFSLQFYLSWSMSKTRHFTLLKHSTDTYQSTRKISNRLMKNFNFVRFRIPCVTFGRTYPGLNENFAMFVENV